MSFKQYVGELASGELNEVKVKRAWSNKLSQIDSLLSWMYEKDILNKGEKAKKDSLFRKYYRFYNDGDNPRGKNYNGKSQYELPEILETELEDFIKKILSKYMSKIDRKGFRIDKQLGDLKTVLSVIQRNDVRGLTKYWKKDIKDQSVLEMIDTLESDFDNFTKILDDFVDSIDFEKDYGLKSYEAPRKGHTASYIMQQLESLGITIPSEITNSWSEIKSSMSEIGELVSNILESLHKLKDLRK